jgi:predicted adenine nucleotide alpha hydrolase (AANH) superfamily ATPase
MTGCLESLAQEGIEPGLLWHNPNIHPFTEYQSRRDALVHFAASKKLNLASSGGYGLRPFLQAAASVPEKPERCAMCYRLRLEKTASYAAENGFDAFSSSLLASPWQNHDAIRRIGEAMAALYGPAFFYRDFRPRFREGQAAARSMGLYMQKYCGCVFSEEERYARQAAKAEQP